MPYFIFGLWSGRRCRLGPGVSWDLDYGARSKTMGNIEATSMTAMSRLKARTFTGSRSMFRSMLPKTAQTLTLGKFTMPNTRVINSKLAA